MFLYVLCVHVADGSAPLTMTHRERSTKANISLPPEKGEELTCFASRSNYVLISAFRG